MLPCTSKINGPRTHNTPTTYVQKSLNHSGENSSKHENTSLYTLYIILHTRTTTMATLLLDIDLQELLRAHGGAHVSELRPANHAFNIDV